MNRLHIKYEKTPPGGYPLNVLTQMFLSPTLVSVLQVYAKLHTCLDVTLLTLFHFVLF